MKKFLTLLKFEFLANTSRAKDDGFFSLLRKAVFYILGVGAIIAFFLYAISGILDIFISAEMQHEFLTYFMLILLVVQLIYGLVASLKTLYLKTDSSILKLPVNGNMIFGAKFLYLYVKELTFTLILALPILIMFGIKTAQGVMFFLMLFPSILVLPIIPYFLAILLSAPALFIMRLFRNKFLVILLFYIVMLTIGFTAYIFVLRFVLNTLESSNVKDVFSDGTLFNIKLFASYLYLPQLFKNCLMNYHFWQSVVILCACVLTLGVLVYWFANKVYFNIVLLSAEGEERSFKKSTRVVDRTPRKALMIKEFKNIFRSPNYSFQYLTMVVTTPLMVFFSSKIASNIGVSALGSAILPGIVVLVLIMFLSMGTSFSATSVTREGENFFHTKIIPVPFKEQVKVKFEMYLFVSVPAVFVSCLVLCLAGFISFLQGLLIAVAVSFIIVGNIARSILLDIKRPQFLYLENGEVSANNKNIASSISVGLIISILMGAGSIIVSYFIALPSMYLVLFGFGVPYAILEIFALFHKIEKRYRQIEV